MPRYKLTLEYNGTPFAGWQRQAERISIQQALEEAAQAFCGEAVEVVGAGRTDAGVHATAQVAHVDLPREYTPYQVMMGLNFHLLNHSPLNPPASGGTLLHSPPACGGEGGEWRGKKELPIAVTAAERVPDDFHARFSATKRHYLYRILNRRPAPALMANRVWHIGEPLDAEAMHHAAQILLGPQDFTSFRDSQCQAKSPLKTLDTITLACIGEEIHCNLSARSFLHHQVRIIIGTLSLVGKGKWKEADIQAALEARNRAAAGPTAPPEGLYLTGVEYGG